MLSDVYLYCRFISKIFPVSTWRSKKIQRWREKGREGGGERERERERREMEKEGGERKRRERKRRGREREGKRGGERGREKESKREKEGKRKKRKRGIEREIHAFPSSPHQWNERRATGNCSFENRPRLPTASKDLPCLQSEKLLTKSGHVVTSLNKVNVVNSIQATERRSALQENSAVSNCSGI
ncbi:hypothetical protein FHG87_013427 [Trinorchestia longiramus]|nr:hypothetical protein FHG87_013427 [Trinorchestia longiramus]